MEYGATCLLGGSPRHPARSGRRLILVGSKGTFAYSSAKDELKSGPGPTLLWSNGDAALGRAKLTQDVREEANSKRVDVVDVTKGFERLIKSVLFA
jgi:hypothetical protein